MRFVWLFCVLCTLLPLQTATERVPDSSKSCKFVDIVNPIHAYEFREFAKVDLLSFDQVVSLKDKTQPSGVNPKDSKTMVCIKSDWIPLGPNLAAVNGNGLKVKGY
jgi:hypothetical protein